MKPAGLISLLKDQRVLLAWALYDFANTIFSAAVMTAYFPLYLTETGGANWYLGLATTGAMILAGLAVPLLGALSDRTGRTKRYLVRTTLACIAFLIPLSFFKSPLVLIFFFVLTCFFFHASLVFYNALLPVVARPGRQGMASGIGVGLGYLGVVAALPFAHFIDVTFGRPAVFTFAAFIFLVFSLPLFFFVPERTVPKPVPFRWGLAAGEWDKIKRILRGLPEKPALLLFLAGNFFAVDTLNAVIFWFAVYIRGVFAPGQGTLIAVMIAVNFAAFLWGFVTGWLTDRFGSQKTLILAAAALALTVLALVMAKSFPVFVTAGLLGGGFAIAGIWTAGRKVLIELAPAEDLGGYFGLYGLTTKISVIASGAFSILADLAGFNRALAFLLFPASMGFLFLLFSKIARRGTPG